MQHLRFCLLLALLPSGLGACGSEGNGEPRPALGVLPTAPSRMLGDRDPSATLRSLAEPLGRRFGVALRTGRLNDEGYAAAAREFNYVTHENELKWNAVEPQPGVFNFTNADRTLEFAESNGMAVKGHTLVWHSQLPGWVKQLGTREEVLAAMERHISTVVGQYRGRIHAWDVVNEAIIDNSARLRGSDPNDVNDPNNSGNNGNDSVFRRLIGEDYIDRAFVLANQADPDAVLFYNDYGGEGTGTKSDAIYALVRGMVERGVPIGGVGLQMHVSMDPGGLAPDRIAFNMQRIADLGLEINITEFDVVLCGGTPIEDRRQRQQARLAGILQTCLDQPRCSAVTMWGVGDRDSWRDRACDGGRAEPLLFDASYQRKDVYYSVFDTLRAAALD